MASQADKGSLTRRLMLLGNQAMALAAQVAGEEVSDEAEREMFDSLPHDSDLWLLYAKDYYDERRRRAQFFDGELFGEPGWDILLDLYIAEKRNERVSTTSACIGSQSPPTTGLRWIQTLVDHDLVERYEDSGDRRRSFVRLTERAYAKMTGYFAENRSALLRDDILHAADRKREPEPEPAPVIDHSAQYIVRGKR